MSRQALSLPSSPARLRAQEISWRADARHLGGRVVKFTLGPRFARTWGPAVTQRKGGGGAVRSGLAAAVFLEARHDLDEVARLVPVIELQFQDAVPCILHRAR